jgi:fatty-acyl-CoA synthase
MINLSSFIAFHARQTPQRCALKYRSEEISYAAFNRRVQIVGGWLASRDIGADDVVAVLMKNSAGFLDIAFAISHIGAVFLPINYRLASDEIAYIVENAGARLLIADEELGVSAAGRAPVVLVDAAAQSDATRLAPDASPAMAHPRRPSDLMRLMYTSAPPTGRRG